MSWAARTAMLVLSLLATFALIESIASISRTAGLGVPGIAPRPAATATVSSGESARLDSSSGPSIRETAPPETGDIRADAPATAASSAPRDREAQWLEAIAYALLGIAALLAVGVIGLMRLTAHVARIADRQL